jgi:hypothetical protein
LRKVAVIIGGTNCISLCTAKRFVSERAYVSLQDFIKKKSIKLSEIGKNVTGIQSNASNLADIDKMYDVVKD